MNLMYNRIISYFLDDENRIVSPFNPKIFIQKNILRDGYKDQILRINSYCERKGNKVNISKTTFLY